MVLAGNHRVFRILEVLASGTESKGCSSTSGSISTSSSAFSFRSGWYLNRGIKAIITAVSSDKMWSTGEGNGKPLQYSCLENPMNSMKRQKDRTLKDELPRSAGAQNTTGYQQRNNYRKNEETKPKQKQHPLLDVNGVGSKVQCCKEQYCIGT